MEEEFVWLRIVDENLVGQEVHLALVPSPSQEAEVGPVVVVILDHAQEARLVNPSQRAEVVPSLLDQNHVPNPEISPVLQALRSRRSLNPNHVRDHVLVQSLGIRVVQEV